MHPAQSWPSVGEVDPARLVDARLQLHHATQLVVSLGISLLPPREDDSHTNLEWIPSLAAFAGRPVEAKRVFRGALRVADLTLLMLDQSNTVRAEQPLLGKTARHGFEWIRARVQEAGADANRLTRQRHYSIPSHAVDTGAAFDAPVSSLRELARYYAGADQLLSAFAAGAAGASEVRCWPHHFDIATLVTLPEGGKTVGLGLSPGDEFYAEPYYYVSPHPSPRQSFPALSRGAWHTTGWVGTIMTGSMLVDLDGPDQAAEVHGFLAESFDVCRHLLGAEPARAT